MGIRVRVYIYCFISFILGGSIFGYLSMKFALDFYANFNIHLSHASYIVKGTDSMRIIKNIENEEFDQAIFWLESEINTAKILLDNSDCEVCKESNERTYKMLLEYEFIQYPEYPENEKKP